MKDSFVDFTSGPLVNGGVLTAGVPNFEEFDPDEGFLLIGSAVICVIGFVHWVRRLRSVSTLGTNRFHRAPIYFSGLVGFVLLGWVIARWADPQIRANSGYILLVMLMGGAFLVCALTVMPWLGLSLRDDALERRNPAGAVLALSGAILGILITYAAANTGSGPSFWNNVFSTLLATGSLLVCWLVVALLGEASSSIAEERDLPSGLRAAGLFLALGLILGRAVAGDWVSAGATVRDFARDGWPGLALCLVAVGVERLVRPTRSNPGPSLWAAGVLPLLVYVLAAAAWLVHLGWWPGGAP